MTRGGGFFRGAELSRLLVLAAIMVAGWMYVWHYVQTRPGPADPPPPTAGALAIPTVADTSPEFAALKDKTPLSFRDTAAYAALLERARSLSPDALAARARRDLLFTHLWERPETYRGIPVHLLGTARRVLSYESKLSRTGRLHEAWIFTPESQNHPYVCVFEDLPEGFPQGGDVSERVVFNGYFLKLMSYQAGDVPRAAPLLVGRLGWSATSAASAKSEGKGPLFWTLVVLGGMFLVSFARWIWQMQRWLAPRSAARASSRRADEISPEALSDWLGSVADEDEGSERTGTDREAGE